MNHPLHAAAVLARGLYLTIRVSTLGFTLPLPLLGHASAQRELPLDVAGPLLAIGLAFHVFAYVLNDVMDLPVDRGEPLRADSLLVRGVIRPSQALALALLPLPLAFAIAWAAGAPPAALLALGAAFAGMAAYDVYGKRCRWPLLTDAVQALGWCALMAVGLHWQAAPPRADTPWLLAYVFLTVLLVNGVHGGLRDVDNDRRAGARTTAIAFGVRVGTDGRLQLPPAFAAYTMALQAALIGCALMALARLQLPPAGQAAATAMVLAALALSTGLGLLAWRRRERLPSLLAAGGAQIVATLAVMPALYLPWLDTAAAVTVLACFTLPAIAMFGYNRAQWFGRAAVGPARR